MKRIVFSLLMVSLLYGCSQQNKEVLHFFTWNEYMDETTIKQFEKENNVKVQMDYYANNEEAMAKIEQEMKMNNKHSSYYDVMLPSDYIIEYMLKKDMLEKIDIQTMQNIKDNILPHLALPFDKKHEYSIPYAWGTVGILYNSKEVIEPISTWKDILEPQEKYKGKILMIDSPKELIGVALKSLNLPFNSENSTNLSLAQEVLKKQSPFVLSYNGDAIQDGMANKEALLAVSWSAEAGYAMAKNKDLRFVVPKEGSNLWSDNFVILKGSKKITLAHQFINFFYRNDIQQRNYDYMRMSVPSKVFFEKLVPGNIGKTWENDPSIIKKLEPNRDSSDDTRKTLYNIYTSIRS